MDESFGLKINEIKLIRSILFSDPAVNEAIIFGSRAMGNFKRGSDIDIAVKGININLQTIIRLSNILNEENTMPYFFDLVNYNSIKSNELREHIDRVGINI